ncbi:MAG: hypothetical protein WD824_05975 [Cyclobacteriaceae bacterium]
MLEEKPVYLNEIVVKAGSRGWKRNFEDFKKSFIGTTKNSRKTTIVNTEGLHLYLDPDTRILVAHTLEPLVIENRALGYRITCFLERFEFHKNEGTVFAFSIPKFEALKPKNIKELELWTANRKAAYSGSIMHFFRALTKSELHQNGFDIKMIYEVPDGNTVVDQKIEGFESDSLLHRNLWSTPGYIDSIGGGFVHGHELFEAGSSNKIQYKGKLAIRFQNELEEPGYLLYARKGKREMQTSKINFLEEGIVIYPNGSHKNAAEIMVEGYWSWSETMSDLLPLDYE